MVFDIESYASDYATSEYFTFLKGPAKNHAEMLLTHFWREAEGLADGFPEHADAELFARVLNERMAQVDLPLAVRQDVPGLLVAFFEYLSASGKYPQADAWVEWIPAVERDYLALFREDGSVKGETVRKKIEKVGRNDPCPCGSGKKFKKCCISLLT